MTPTSRGIALKIGATLAFSLQYVALKLAGDVPVGEVVFFRAFFALIPLFVFAQFTIGMREVVKTERPWLHLMRAAIGSSSMFLGFAALKLLPLADITAFAGVNVSEYFKIEMPAELVHLKAWRERVAARPSSSAA